MKTGLKKSQKTTEIYFDDAHPIIMVCTYNTGLKNRLLAFSKQYPACCKLTDDNEMGGLSFEIEKGRLSFRLTAPYSEERRRAVSEQAKKSGIHTRRVRTFKKGNRFRFSGAANVREIDSSTSIPQDDY